MKLRNLPVLTERGWNDIEKHKTTLIANMVWRETPFSESQTTNINDEAPPKAFQY